jgi:hypothetical protein
MRVAMRGSVLSRKRQAIFATAAVVVVAALLVAPSFTIPSNTGGRQDPQAPLPPVSDDEEPIAVTTIEEGDWSGYRYGDSEFNGGCIAIRNRADWTTFWGIHAGRISPEPPIPEVDFQPDLVLGCILGYVRNCCLSQVTVDAVASKETAYRVSVDRHFEDGIIALAAITNPYHIASVAKTSGQVVFFDAETGEHVPDIPLIP